MQHNAAFHQGLHCLLRLNQIRGRKHIIIENSTCSPIKIHNGQPHTFCINMNVKIHQNKKGN